MCSRTDAMVLGSYFALMLAYSCGLRVRAEVITEDSYLNTLRSTAPLSCSEGFTELGYYNGSVSQTDSGLPCLRWTEFPDYVQQYPGRGLGDHSYCRNPDRESNPWCFFRQSSGAVGWAYCDCHQGAARLVGSSSPRSGRLEVYLNGQWGAVCDTHLTDRDASVICSQLGLGDIGTALQHSYFGPGTGLFHYERLGCRGNENSLLECRSRKFVTGDCNHGNEASVVCAPPEGNGAPLRLVGGLEEFEGRVEVYYNGRWGTVCDDKWDDVDAEVVCRQLGLGGIPKAWSWAHFGQGSGPIMLDAVQCSGNELSLDECAHGGWEQHNCDHMEDAGVSCSPYTDGVVRLVGADSPWEGRLEVFHAGDWGTICSRNWTGLQAQVVCRQLGFRGRAEVAPDGTFGEGAGLILLDGVRCTGTELSLLDCEHGVWGRHDCKHTQDVGVHCEDGAETNHIPAGPPVSGPLIRLVGGRSRKEGRVEVLVDGQWGVVCEDGWNDRTAQVICRQLGFGGVSKARPGEYFREESRAVRWGRVRCSGREAALGDCPVRGHGVLDCKSGGPGVTCDHTPGTEDVGAEEGRQSCGMRPQILHRGKRTEAEEESLESLSESWPWQVSLWPVSQPTGGHPLCIATLIDPCWALTAAHCFKRFGRDPSSYLMQLGGLGPRARSLTPERIIIHEKYRSAPAQGWEYDIALLKLPGAEGRCVTFDLRRNAACLPATWMEARHQRPDVCIITGRPASDSGRPSSALQSWAPLLPAWKCKDRYGDRYSSRMLCVGSLPAGRRAEACHADDGGPLVCHGEGGRWILTGVVSWGRGCADPVFPGVYTPVARFLHWIEQVTGHPAEI
ncbi:neurotrypsin isoform X1 [Paramormyrops kingsleyae]|uniref:neurotrypsin isoform X1 n=1 Tax=Paramormyrops kingsleyae TaxID=1676925 RepID=UPI000CD61F5E|nr:neurotrypsin-like isoform X1 [Paramormyrops kingsleyae]